MKGLWKKFALAAGAAAIGGYVLYSNTIDKDAPKPEELSFTEFDEAIDSKGINHIVVHGQSVTGEVLDGAGAVVATYSTNVPLGTDSISIFGREGVDLEFEETKVAELISFISYIPMLGIMGLILYQTGLFKRLFDNKFKKKTSDVRFDDVAGIDEIRDEAQEIVNFLKDSKKGNHLGARMPRGLMMVGSPGNGKTLLTKAIAGEAGVPFYAASSTSFENMYYGESAKEIRQLFGKARKSAPSIIFIDEFDAIGRKRSDSGTAAQDSIVVEILNQLDGFEPLEGVLVIVATNRPEILDPALLRPGRFDRQLVVPTPDIKARAQVLEVHSKTRPLDADVDLLEIAKRTYGFSGAELANLVNEAAIQANRRPDAETVTLADFEFAIDRIVMGLKRNLSLTPDQKQLTAVHEAGHTILALEMQSEGAVPFHKVTIMPHGQAMGLTVSRPDEEVYGYRLKQLKAQLVVIFGGRIAEELMFGGPDNVSTGASGDIQQATNIAWNMVTKYGFSSLGPVKYGNGHEGFLGAPESHGLDGATSARVYVEVQGLITEAESRAREILTREKPALEKLTAALLEKETMMGQDVKKLLSYPKPAAPAA